MWTPSGTLFRRGLLTVAALMALMFGFGSTAFSASAATGSTVAASASTSGAAAMGTPELPDSSTGRGVCTGSIKDGSYQTDRPLLPVQRWSGAMSFHTRLGWKDVGDSVMRQGVMSMGMAAGNTFWALSTGIVQYATAFCPLDRAGGVADHTFYRLGKAVRDSMLLTALVFFTLIVYAFRLAKGAVGGADIKQLLGGGGNGGAIATAFFKKGMIIAIFMVMLTGASHSTGGGIDGSDAPFKPGIGSPGWFVVTIDQVTSNLTSTIVAAMPGIRTAEVSEPDNGAPNYDPRNPYSCESYVKAMHEAYRDNYYLSGKSYKQASALPLALNSFWEEGGLEAWKNAQFGTDSNYGNIVYCRMLESNSGAQVGIPGRTDEPKDGTIAGLMHATGVDYIDPDALAWTGSSSNDVRDRIYVAWAACTHAKSGPSYEGWSIPHGTGADNRMGLWPDNMGNNGTEDKGVPEECDYVWGDNNDDADAPGGARNGSEDGNDANGFDWESGGGKIDDGGNNSAQGPSTADADFLKNLHGVEFGSGLVIIAIYIFSSLLLLLVFGAFGIAVIFAKILALVMIVGVLVALVGALMPNGDLDRVAKYGKQYIGISIFAFGASLLLAILTLFTSILIEVGNDTLPGGRGGIMPLMWAGIAPFVAALAIHYMFKKANIPSPFSPAAAGAWGKSAAGGTVGSAVGAGVGTYAGQRYVNRAKSAAADKAKGSLPSMKRNAGNTTATTNGQGKMGPKGTGTGSGTGAGTGAGSGSGVGAAAGAAAGTAVASEEARRHDEQKAVERENLNKTERARAEREDAQAEQERRKAWAESDEGKAAIAAQKAKQQGRRPPLSPAKRLNESLASARQQFREKPLQTIGKGALKTAKYGALGVVASTGVGGVALVGGYAAYKMSRNGGYVNDAVRRGTGQVTGRTNRTAEDTAYRVHQWHEEEARKAAEAQAQTDAQAAALVEAQKRAAALPDAGTGSGKGPGPRKGPSA